MVDTVKYLGVDAPDQGTVYWPLNARDRSRFILIRSDRPSALAGALHQTMRELDPNLALTGVATIEDLVTGSLATPRYLSVLVGAFAVSALLLSLVGIYGVVTHFVQQHRRENGIRLALGGDPVRLYRLVIGQALTVVAIGATVGVAATFLTSRIVSSVLFGVTATDPRTIVLVPGFLIVAAILACAVPAWQAATVDPAEVLRQE